MKYPELWALRCSSHLSISPDGSKCAFLVHTPEEAENTYTGHVYVSGFTAASPAGAPGVDGLAWMDVNTLLISRSAKGGGTAFFRLSVDSGLEEPFAEIPFKAAIEGFLGGELLLSAYRPITEEKAGEDGGWTVLDELPVWKDGIGYCPKLRRRLFLCSGGGKTRCISSDGMDVRLVSTDRVRVVYAGYTPNVLDGPANEIHCWDGTDCLVYKLPGEVTQLALSGPHVFLASLPPEAEAGAAPTLMRGSISGSALSALYKSELAIGNFIVSDAGSQGKTFTADGDTLYFVATEHGSSQIYMLAPGTVPVRMTSIPGSIDQLDVHAARIVFSGLRGSNCHEVYHLNGGEQRLSFLHREGRVSFYPVTPIHHRDIQGWALREEAENMSHPAVLFLHDGPQQAFGPVYHFGMQLLAQHGYVVLSANLPGSIGYGNTFAALGGHWGETDCQALLSFLDAALAACPEIDAGRVAVAGTGYGAYLAAVAAGKTNRFAAAICDGVISNCVSMEATSDHGAAFAAKHMKASGYTQPEKLWKCSPLSLVPSIKTPTLILHGELDRSSHLSQGQMLFTALKVHGVPTRMCIFPGESHQLASTGTPAARKRYYSEVLRWLALYL